MKIITIATIKGGTGKTTTAAAIAQAAAKDGKRVLAIDLDPQSNLTFSLKANPNADGAVQIFRGAAAADVIQETEQHIFVISAHRDLSTVKTSPGSASRLRGALLPIKEKFDICIIDTPPTIGELVYNALNAADGLLIPLETDTFSLQGLYQINDVANQIRQHNSNLKVLGAILTRYDGRSNLNKYLHGVIKTKCEELGTTLLSEIRSGIAAREAAAMQKSLFDYAPKSKPAEDYLQLYKIIATHLE